MLHLQPHPALHTLLEALGYTFAFALYRHLRRRSADVVTDRQRGSVIAAAVLGALVGSRVLGLLEQAPRFPLHWHALVTPGSGGKTIVGGLLGGWLAVELTKKAQGLTTRTGDLFALPLCLGIAVGRIGCLLAGLLDDTYGKPTTLPWAVDFGDGIPRHPTQLYEILFLAVLALALHLYSRRPHPNGAVFRWFMAGYLSWRLLIDTLKPGPLVLGMTAIQWACFAGLLALVVGIRPRSAEHLPAPHLIR